VLSRKIWLAIVLLIVLGAACAWYILITPSNPLTRMFQREISDVNARIIIGPYPEDRDFELLKRNGVGLVVTLLNPEIPYEANLLEREKGVAARHGIELRSFPMSSILGQRFGDEYDRSAAAAADAIATSESKVYLHCYLGMHRIQVVRDLLARRGVEAGTYTVRKGERDASALALDAAEKASNAGRHQEALDALSKVPEDRLTDNARMLIGWSHYRLNRIGEARDAFSRVQQHTPGHTESLIGLGYCAYRESNYADAEQHFTRVVTAAPANADALGGLGLTMLRAGKLEEARTHLAAALKIAPDNQELRDALVQAGGRP
jgi:tetratricopeptide (TPR) repeat protein